MSAFKSRFAAVVASTAILAVAGTTGAVAAKMIDGGDIKNGTVTSKDIKNNSLIGYDIKNGSIGAADISDKGKEKLASSGVNLDGAVYRVANYKNGGAGDATVACADTEAESMKYIAVAGGVQAGGVQSMGQDSEFDVAGSFPGRMDWSTGAPKADRLDGWIILGSGGWSETLKVWTLCVPNTNIAVEVTDIDN